MSGSQHNPNGRQAQLGSGWSPLQLQMANLLARAPQAHMASERGVTWHTPTPPPHLYHVPAPSPPDPLQLQAMKGAGNSVFRHTATPPELYRHTPTPPDKHLLRHTPSPGDVKAGAALPPADLYAHLGPARDKLVRPEDLLTYARGVDLSLSSRSANGSAAPALSVRDAPTINSLIARVQPRPHHARVDSLLERLAPSPHSVIVHSRAAHTPSPPSSEDSGESAPAQGAKRKRKPERTIRLAASPAAPLPLRVSPVENGNGPEKPLSPPPDPHVRRKTRSGSAETIDDIAAMIASTDDRDGGKEPPREEPAPAEPPVTIDKLKSVLASPETKEEKVEEVAKSPPKVEEKPDPPPEPVVEAAAPRRRSTRTSNSEASNAPVESPSEGRAAEPEPAAAPAPQPTAASFVEVENQLEKMFAGIEEAPPNQEGEQQVEKEKPQTTKARKRRKSAPTKGERKAARRCSRASTGDGKRKGTRAGRGRDPQRDAYDSGSNASSGRSRGPYIQIRGPRDSPLSVAVINAGAEEEGGEGGGGAARRREHYRNGLRARGLHCSTLGLRYDATTPDATWLCAFCERGPHAAGLGDLFGPYPLDTDCDEYRALDETSRRRHEGAAWLHEACAVWAPGLLAAGARLWGLAGAVWSCRGARCVSCSLAGANVSCGARGCRARAHVPCARGEWTLREEDFHALCPRHAPPPHPS